MERDYSLDLIRVVAMSFVVAVHCLSVVDTESSPGHYFYLISAQVLFTCNSLFFMLSGKLNIRKRNDDQIYDYYLRKTRNIVIPILVVFVFYTAYVLKTDIAAESFAIQYLEGVLWRYGSNTPYWFMYTLVGFLALAPFLGRMFSGMQRRHIIVFCILGLSYNTVIYITSNSPSIDFGWGYPLKGFAFIFCFGALIDKVLQQQKLSRIIMLSMPLCLLLNSILIENDITKNAYDLSPMATILSIGMYCLIIRISTRIDFGKHKNITRALLFLSSQSFIVYLLHTMFLGAFKSIFSGYSGIVSIFAQIGCTVCVLMASLIASVVLKTVVVKPLQSLYDAIIRHATNTIRSRS